MRAAGVTALRAAGRADEAEPFLYDRSALVRACARWVLRQTGTDPLPLYRAACAAGDAVPLDAPLGLAECGDRAADADALWALTGHARPRVRASAVAGLRVLDAVRFDAAGFERLAPLLNDDSPRVARAAALALAPWADHLPVGALLPPEGEFACEATAPDRAGHRAEGGAGAEGDHAHIWALRTRRALRMLRLPFGRGSHRATGA